MLLSIHPPFIPLRDEWVKIDPHSSPFPIHLTCPDMHVTVVEEPLPKKCNIKGLRMKVTVPTKTLHILNAEVVLITVWALRV